MRRAGPSGRAVWLYQLGLVVREPVEKLLYQFECFVERVKSVLIWQAALERRDHANGIIDCGTSLIHIHI
jgi:hypothetical protein